MLNWLVEIIQIALQAASVRCEQTDGLQENAQAHTSTQL